MQLKYPLPATLPPAAGPLYTDVGISGAKLCGKALSLMFTSNGLLSNSPVSGSAFGRNVTPFFPKALLTLARFALDSGQILPGSP